MRAAVRAGPALCCLVLSGLVPRAQAAGLEVVVDGIEPRSGTVYVALCQGGLSEGACPSGRGAPAGAASGRFVFDGIAPGVYAVAAYQDLNGNGRLDRTGLGLPTEPYGLSGRSARRSRPDFAAASFALGEAGASLHIRLARTLGPR